MIDIKRLYKLSFSKAASTYEEEASIQKQTAQIIAQKVKDLDGLYLDCGCGTCFINDVLKDKSIINLDISLQMVKICKQKGYNTVVADIESMPFKDESFDCVVSNFTLHWTDIEIALKEIYRVLKSGGVFVFSIPIEGSLRAIADITGSCYFQFENISSLTEKLSRLFKISEYSVIDFNRDMPDGISFLRHLHLTGSMINPKELSLKEKIDIVKKFSSYKSPVTLNFTVAFFCCQKS